VLVHRLRHLKHVHFLTAKDRLQLIVCQNFSFILWILKIVLLNVCPNLFVTSVRGSGSVPTILARCSEGCIGFIKALVFALGVVFAIFALHPCRKRTQLHDHKNCNGLDWQMCIKLDETTEDQERSASRTLLERGSTSTMASVPFGDDHPDTDHQK